MVLSVFKHLGVRGVNWKEVAISGRPSSASERRWREWRRTDFGKVEEIARTVAAQETDEAAVKRFMEYINEFRDETKTKTRPAVEANATAELRRLVAENPPVNGRMS